jgi:hypothetical protein
LSVRCAGSASAPARLPRFHAAPWVRLGLPLACSVPLEAAGSPSGARQCVVSRGPAPSTVFVVDKPQGLHCKTKVCFPGTRRMMVRSRIGWLHTGQRRSSLLSFMAAASKAGARPSVSTSNLLGADDEVGVARRCGRWRDVAPTLRASTHSSRFPSTLLDRGFTRCSCPLAWQLRAS